MERVLTCCEKNGLACREGRSCPAREQLTAAITQLSDAHEPEESLAQVLADAIALFAVIVLVCGAAGFLVVRLSW